jgi:uncharacterized protein (TIGR02145 family)
MILANQESTNNSLIEKYCINNDPVNCTLYGGLYQWNEAMQYSTTLGSRGICPPGWHIPTKEEFQDLIIAVIDNSNALKAVGEGTGLGAGTNSSGFSGLLVGDRNHNGSGFGEFGQLAIYWGSDIYDANYSKSLVLSCQDPQVSVSNTVIGGGISVRCIKDNSSLGTDNSTISSPNDYFLSQNYPNPFNPTTSIKFSLPKESKVKLIVYNSLGQEICSLLDSVLPSGEHVVYFDGSKLSSGIYIYKLEAANFIQTKKMSLIK